MSGFAIAHYHLAAAETAATSLAIYLALAPLTISIAQRHGRSSLIWTVMALSLGAWALAAVLMFGRRPTARAVYQAPEFQPPSAAA